MTCILTIWRTWTAGRQPGHQDHSLHESFEYWPNRRCFLGHKSLQLHHKQPRSWLSSLRHLVFWTKSLNSQTACSSHWLMVILYNHAYLAGIGQKELQLAHQQTLQTSIQSLPSYWNSEAMLFTAMVDMACAYLTCMNQRRRHYSRACSHGEMPSLRSLQLSSSQLHMLWTEREIIFFITLKNKVCHLWWLTCFEHLSVTYTQVAWHVTHHFYHSKPYQRIPYC